MKERFQVVPVVLTVVRQEDSVLLLRRNNTGYMDGYYDVPSGHLEPEEQLLDAAVREVKEETDIDINPVDLSLCHVYQNDGVTGERPYLGFVFQTSIWKGTARNVESHKHDDVRFFPFSKLPRVTPQVKAAISHLLVPNSVTFSYFHEGEIKAD